jgi:import inner membrane translocase subunit TIM8
MNKNNPAEEYEPGGDQGEALELTETEMDYLNFVAEEIRGRASIQQAVGELSEICWDKCVSKPPGKYLTTNEQKCISYCVQRYLETSNYIMMRLQQIATRIIRRQGAEMGSPPPPPLFEPTDQMEDEGGDAE